MTRGEPAELVGEEEPCCYLRFHIFLRDSAYSNSFYLKPFSFLDGFVRLTMPCSVCVAPCGSLCLLAFP